MEDGSEGSRYPGLQIDPHLRQQEWEWRIQRISWVFFYALLAAILLGALGRGPLSQTRLQAPGGGFEMEYERFMRHLSPDLLRVTVRPASDHFRLRFENGYIERVQVEQIVPEPQETVSEEGATVFVFKAAAARPAQVEIYIRPQKIGAIEGRVALDDGPPQAFGHFVYP